jgi:hypothetical protein
VCSSDLGITGVLIQVTLFTFFPTGKIQEPPSPTP